jgi:hypothetical protein
MTTIVACSLPGGLLVDHANLSIKLNGANVGADMDNLARNGFQPDTADRVNGFGLTELQGDQEAAFLDWAKAVGEKPDNAQIGWQPFAPIATKALVWAKSRADVSKETQDATNAAAGLDPDKDLPPDVTEDTDAKKVK